MKKFLLYIALFFVAVCVVDFSYGKFCDYMNSHAKGGATKQRYDVCKEKQYDVLILGSSRAHHHYVPQVLEDSLSLTCFNAGEDGNGIILMYGIYNMIRERYLPKYIIYDVEPAFDIYKYDKDANRTRYLALQKPYYRNAGVASIFKDISMPESYKVRSGLYRYNSEIFPLAVDFLIGSPMNCNGYVPISGVMSQEPSKDTNGDSHSEIDSIDSVKLAYFEKFVQLASKDGVKVYVVASPKYGAMSSSDLSPLFDICKKEGIHVFDYYCDSTFMDHKEYFKEPMHLNDEGAQCFSKLLASEMKYSLGN